MAKRIVFSTNTPNDQGGIIPNETIDFDRYNANPVILKQHSWGSEPLGLMTEIKLENGKWTGLPVFHGITDDSKLYKNLYEGDWLRSCSIGGEAIWEENSAGQYKLDADGNRTCKKFNLYEISMVTLPSNADAVTLETALAVHFYDSKEIKNISETIIKLSSKYKPSTMENEVVELTDTEKAAAIEAAKTEKKTKLDSEKKPDVLASDKNDGNQLPGWLNKILGLKAKVTFDTSVNEAPAPSGEPESKPGASSVTQPQPTPIGLKAEKEKKAMEKAKKKAEDAIASAKSAKEKADKEGASDDDKKAYESAATLAKECMQNAEAAEKAYNDAMDEDDEEESSKNSAAEKTTNAAAPASNKKPVLKTMEQLKAEFKDVEFVPKPTRMTKVNLNDSRIKPISLMAADKEGRQLINRVQAADGPKNVDEYRMLLEAFLKDGKFAAIAEKLTFMMNVNADHLGAYRKNPNIRSGKTLKDIAATLDSGYIPVLNRNNVYENRTVLNATDDFLAAPDLLAIEFLPLAIFQLFPSTSWKNDIPLFGAQLTSDNAGLIWANIAADPTIYKGSQPSSPANYSYTDTAVSLALINYWLQPMIWTPLTMHQLRYDQMGTGWQQAFAKWGAYMDDELIYTLASTVPAASILSSTGLSGYQTVPQTFPVAPNTPNSFYWNPTFSGTLNNPVLNDVITLEQIYRNQNFELAQQGATLVVDTVAEAYLAKDPETKSLLTRWVNQEGGEFTKFKNTILPARSRVAIYDPASGQVKDPYGTIPSTAVSAMVGFIPNQVGIGIGMLDVFMVQDPTNYGFKMSADIRIGIVPLRANHNGTTLYTYGTPPVPPA